jgi:hypothetical protein
MDEQVIDLRVSQIAERHHGVFAAEHLRALAVPDHVRRHRLATGRWEPVHERVYRIVGTPLEWRGRVLAACWAGGTRAVASHRTGAELRGLPGGSIDPIEITCPRWRRARHDGLVVHESLAFPDDEIDTVDGIPTTTVNRTLFDLASIVKSSVLDIAIENALRRGLTTVRELERTLVELGRRGRPGTQQFRQAVELHQPVRAFTESDAEHRLLRIIERHGFPTPVVQHEIRDTDGRLVARVDFAYPDLKIAIEYDSYVHHLGRDALVRDGMRRNKIVALGWLPITATANDVKNGGQQIADDLRRARALRTCAEVGE